MAGQLERKVVVVTGAAQGMGRSHAERCVAEGAHVVATDIRADAGRAAVEPLGEAAVFAEHDVTDEAGWARVAATAIERFGRLDGLVNNAAIYPAPTPIEHEDRATLERALQVNLVGSWLGIRAVVPAMRAAGGGSIVNISSLAGIRGYERLGSYAMSKWAVRGLTRTAARELGPDGIRVNSVHPGTIDETGMFNAPTDPDAYDRLYRQMPLRRPAVPAEVSGVVVHLLSDASSYVTGAEHLVDGGSWA